MTSSTKAAAPRIATPVDEVGLGEVAPSRALAAHGDRPAASTASRRSASGGGVRQLDRSARPGTAIHVGVPRQPQADLDPAGHGGRGDREGLVEAFGEPRCHR